MNSNKRGTNSKEGFCKSDSTIVQMHKEEVCCLRQHVLLVNNLKNIICSLACSVGLLFSLIADKLNDVGG